MYLYSKYLKKFTKAKASLPIIVGTTILSSLFAQSARSAQITFSFTPTNESGYPPGAINNWGHGNSPNYGWISGRNTGTATDSGTGLNITFTGAPPSSTTSNNLVGTAQTNAENFKFDSRNLTTKGLKIENINLSDDGNFKNLTVTNGKRVLSNGTLDNYQLLTFSFTEPIIIDSDTRFFIDDIDDNSTTGTNESYIDALGIEAFDTPNVGTPGTGIDPNFSLENTTELTTSSINFANGNNVRYVYDEIDSNVNPANIPVNRAYYDFGSTQEVQSIALYYFNGVPTSKSTGTNGHAVVFGGSFDVETIPFEFSPGWGLLLSGGGLLGIKHLKRSKLSKQHSLLSLDKF